MIKSVDYLGVERVLIYSDNGMPVKENAVATTFRGERVRIGGARAPHKPGSTGKVYVYYEGASDLLSLYPGVLGMAWL